MFVVVVVVSVGGVDAACCTPASAVAANSKMGVVIRLRSVISRWLSSSSWWCFPLPLLLPLLPAARRPPHTVNICRSRARRRRGHFFSSLLLATDDGAPLVALSADVAVLPCSWLLVSCRRLCRHHFFAFAAASFCSSSSLSAMKRSSGVVICRTARSTYECERVGAQATLAAAADGTRSSELPFGLFRRAFRFVYSPLVMNTGRPIASTIDTSSVTCAAPSARTHDGGAAPRLNNTAGRTQIGAEETRRQALLGHELEAVPEDLGADHLRFAAHSGSGPSAEL